MPGVTKMEREKAKQILLEEGRFVYNVETAKEIAKAFGLELDESLIRKGKLGYREQGNENPRVNISSLSEWVCNQLGKKPDEKILQTANKMSGEGSYRDLKSEAYAINL